MKLQKKSNINLCDRCKVQRADYQCNQCCLNGMFCSTCDAYLHSMQSKRNHKRLLINPSLKEELNSKIKTNFSIDGTLFSPIKNSPNSRNLNNANNLNNLNNQNSLNEHAKSFCDNCEENLNYDYKLKNDININDLTSKSPKKVLIEDYNDNTIENQLNYKYNIPPKKSATQNLVNEIKDIYENEKVDLQNRIIDLTNEINDAKLYYNENINSLHKYLDDANVKHKNEIKEINNDNLLDMHNLINDKDEQIQKLVNEIRERENELVEEEKNEQNLLIRVKDFEGVLLENKYNYENDICGMEQKIKSAERMFKEQEEYYKLKNDELTNYYKQRKEQLVQSYKKTIDELKKGYSQNQNEKDKTTNDKEVYLNTIIDKKEKEIKELRNEVKKIQNDIDKNTEKSKVLEAGIIKKKEELLKKQSEFLNVQKDYEETKREFEKIDSTVRKLETEYSKLKKLWKKNSIIVYGYDPLARKNSHH